MQANHFFMIGGVKNLSLCSIPTKCIFENMYKKAFLFYVAITLTLFMKVSAQFSPNDLLKHAQQLLYAVRTDAPIDSIVNLIAKYDYQSVEAMLDDDSKRKAFWLNIYNAFTQILLSTDEAAYTHRNKFFSQKKIIVAGQKMSLDLIEHGLLRKSKIKISLGYLNKPFVSGLEKKWSIDSLDARIHFALNCGATSCPPIAFYNELEIDTQLEAATINFLKHDAVYDSIKNTVTISKIFSWFRGDFGGKKGTIQFLKTYNILPPDAMPQLIYKKYDWIILKNNFGTE